MLVELLEKEAVAFETLHARYGALLELVRRLIGVVPNCDRYLEIWPPAFRTYNVMVPNLLNLPFLVWGLGAPRTAVGLAAYASSRTAGCPYCSAHTCSFALRGGATVEQVASAFSGGRALSAADRAAVRVAGALASVPAAIDEEARATGSRCQASRPVQRGSRGVSATLDRSRNGVWPLQNPDSGFERVVWCLRGLFRGAASGGFPAGEHTSP